MLKKNIIPDILAGLTVSFAAIALGAAFGTMSGRGAFAGMLAAAVIPLIASTFGGTRIQASGPTAPMTAVSALVIAYAYDHFADRVLAEQFITMVFILTAVIIFLLGVFRSGKLIQLVPNVVIFGFMNGIAALIWFNEIEKLFGLGDFTPFKGSILNNVLIAVGTLVTIYMVPFVLRKLNVRRSIRIFLPGALISILLMTLLTSSVFPNIERVKLGADMDSFSDFTSILISYFPTLEILTWENFIKAAPYAFQIALLGYLDSLLTALVIDKMTKEKSNLNKELMAQGLANGTSALLQGIPGAQATIRSVLLVKEGAQTRMAGVLIGVFGLIGILLLKDYLTLVASAVFVGVLFKAGADVFDFEFPKYYLRHAWFKNKMRNIQLGFIAYTTLITILVDLNVAVISGTILFYICERYFKVVDCETNLAELLEADYENKAFLGAPRGEHHEHKIFISNIRPDKLKKLKQKIKDMRTHTEESQASMTPKKALKYLQAGNERFVQNLKANRNLLQQVNETKDGQFPFAVVLSCIDSRVSAELVFDQGLGDIFSVRIAGNFINEDILGSMEFACKVAGSKLIVVLGHSKCGAISGAIKNVEMGNLTVMLQKIKPAIEIVKRRESESNEDFAQHVSEENVHQAIINIKERSPILSEMLNNGEIGIVGAMYNIDNGEVVFQDIEIHKEKTETV